MSTTEHRCSHCGAKNRIPSVRIADDPACGKCHQKLFPREPVTTTDASFSREVADSAIPVLVDFWAPWCGPCRSMEPTLNTLANNGGGRIKVAKVNVDENPQLARRFAIRSIPALKLFRGDSVVAELNGAVGASELDRFLASHGV